MRRNGTTNMSQRLENKTGFSGKGNFKKQNFILNSIFKWGKNFNGLSAAD
jgi:hypothetical protein